MTLNKRTLTMVAAALVVSTGAAQSSHIGQIIRYRGEVTLTHNHVSKSVVLDESVQPGDLIQLSGDAKVHLLYSSDQRWEVQGDGKLKLSEANIQTIGSNLRVFALRHSRATEILRYHSRQGVIVLKGFDEFELTSPVEYERSVPSVISWKLPHGVGTGADPQGFVQVILQNDLTDTLWKKPVPITSESVDLPKALVSRAKNYFVLVRIITDDRQYLVQKRFRVASQAFDQLLQDAEKEAVSSSRPDDLLDLASLCRGQGLYRETNRMLAEAEVKYPNDPVVRGFLGSWQRSPESKPFQNP